MIADEPANGVVLDTRVNEAGREPEAYALNDQAKRRLGLHLRAMYETFIQQPVPDRFKDLIAQLDDKTATEPENA